MREEDKRRIENVRLVRLPNGQLVTPEQAARLAENVPSPGQSSQSSPQQTRSIIEKKSPKTRRERRKAAHQTGTISNPTAQQDKDILDVWEKQEQIKKETERLELEYEVTKKMAKELKRKLKERDQPFEGESVDDAFKDLLSPEAKQVAKKLQPHLKKVKSASKDRAKLFGLSLKKYGRFVVLLAKKSVSTKKRAAITVSVILITVGALSVYKVFDKPTVKVQDVQGASNTNDGKIEGMPSFDVLLPAQKDANSLGAQTRKTPTGVVVFSYKDDVDGTAIQLTQQELPENFKKNPAELQNFAKDKYFTQKTIQIDTTQVFAGLNQNGTQTAVFAKDGLLVFIKADKELTEVQWVQYVTNLIKK